MQRTVDTLVDKIIKLTMAHDFLNAPEKQSKVRDLERQIDELVYKLYELNEDEIKIVEGS